MNTRFQELARCLTISAGGKSDKESILAEAVEHIQRQAASIRELTTQNATLRSETKELRTEKNELRSDKNYMRTEVDNLRSESVRLQNALEGMQKGLGPSAQGNGEQFPYNSQLPSINGSGATNGTPMDNGYSGVVRSPDNIAKPDIDNNGNHYAATTTNASNVGERQRRNSRSRSDGRGVR